MKIRSLLCAIFIMFLSACQSSKILETSTPTSTSTPQATNTLTPTPTLTPTVTPTPIGGGNGTIIYTEGWTLSSIDTNGKNKISMVDNCSWNITFSPDGHYMTCSIYKKIDDTNSGGFGVILIDLETHNVVKRLAESTLIGENFGSNQQHAMGDLPYYGWSPNSKQFAFTGTYQGELGLFVINLEDLSITLLYKNPTLREVVWSPDGSKILFFENVIISKNPSPPSAMFNSYVINLDGTHLSKLTENPGVFSYEQISWGNDNNTIFIDEKGINLDTMQANGETIPVLGPYQSAIVSPDHKFQVVIDDWRNKLYLESMDGSKKTNIAGKFPVAPMSIPNIQWSPDSKTLSYYDPQKSSIVLMPIDTLIVSPLVKVRQDKKNPMNHYYYGNYLWLPNGKQIVFIQADETGDFAICLSDLSGNIATVFTAKSPVVLYIGPTRH